MQIPFMLACPKCYKPLLQSDGDKIICPHDGLHYQRDDGIWGFILPEDQKYYRKFIREYETVRMEEGRGSSNPHYYQNLPFEDITGKFSHDWKIRAVTFKRFLDLVLLPIEDKFKKALKILDLGSGNGWLANRLAARGHHLAAVDLLTNDWDGLGALKHYPNQIWAFQATFDRLPFASHQADMVVFNASLHYSTNVKKTILESLRVLKGDGCVVILDSPFYTHSESGFEMVQERQAEFKQRFGFPSDAIPSENFLTIKSLKSLEEDINIIWNFFQPWYGLRWAIRPLLARLRHRRQPARFLIVHGTVGH